MSGGVGGALRTSTGDALSDVAPWGGVSASISKVSPGNWSLGPSLVGRGPNKNKNIV